MKTKSKALLMTLCAVLLVAASVLGTMAYLTSTTGPVTNTFSIGKIEITLDEAPVNVDGEAIDGARRFQNAYKLVPGHTYIKDPTVHVTANSENAYIFVKVENGIAAIEADGNKIADQIVTTNGWKQLTDAEGAPVANVYYKEYTKNAAQQDLVVFSNFKIADNIGADTLKNYENNTITITAYAIQKDANLDTAAKAWAAGNFN